MAIDFPASPTLNDVFTVGNVTYVWDGTKWTASVTGGISLDKIEEGNTSAEVIDTGSDGRFVVTTEGTERLRVTDTGRVGIGTTSPTGIFEACGSSSYFRSAAVAGTFFQITAGAANGVVTLTANANSGAYPPLLFNVGGGERARIDTSGRLGIGTSSPTELLAVSGAIKYGSTGYIADGDLGFIYTGSNNNTYGTVIGTKPGTTYSTRRDFTVSLNPANGSGREVFRIEGQGGRVGIGTTPDRTLTVNGIVKSAGRGTSFGYELPDWRIYNSSTGNALVFDNYTTEAFRVDSSNRLLVGTSSGSGNNLLQVQGESGSSAGIGGIVLRRGLAPSLLVSGSIMGRIDFGPNDGGVGASIVGEGDAQQGTSDYPSRLVFSTTADGANSPTERMRIGNNGNVQFTTGSSVYPLTDNSIDLGGGASYRWAQVWAANGTIQTSDQRTKTDVASASLGSDFVKSLRPVSYKWVEGGKRPTSETGENGLPIYESVPGTRTHWGFIAQEVKQAVDATGVDFGGWLLTDKDDPDSQQALRYDQFIAPLTKALQEAIAKIETLEGMVAVNNITIDEQQHQLSTLAARLTALETP
jgi:hypothetical protein